MDVKYAAVDWLTMTSNNEGTGQAWWSMYTKYKEAMRAEGNREKTFHNGFYGGVRIKSMSVGYSDKIGYLVMVSGGDAERLYHRLQPAKHKVTRLDLCADFLFDEPTGLATTLYLSLDEQRKNRKRKFSLTAGSDGGSTLYLGSRSSMQFGRLYDKGVKSGTKEPGLLWRAEVEYKKPLSGSLAKALAKTTPEDREIVITDTVCEWYAQRGAELFPTGNLANAMHIQVQARVTTAKKKLAWLRSQVQPSVTELIELGYGQNVLEVLLLDVETLSEVLHSES